MIKKEDNSFNKTLKNTLSNENIKDSKPTSFDNSQNTPNTKANTIKNSD